MIRVSERTGLQGNASFSFKAPYRSAHSGYDEDYYDPDPVELNIIASVDDGSLQTISATTALNVYPTTDHVALDTGHYYQVPNRPFTLNLQDSTPDGKPVPGRSLTINVLRYSDVTYRADKSVLEQTLLTDGSGKGSLSLSLDAGWYRIQVTGRDDMENKFVYNQWVYVFREARSWRWSSPNTVLKVTLDKAAYRSYETARIAIESSFSGPALLTFERGRVINTRMIELTAPLTLVDAQIIPEHAPNVFVSVNAWQPANCGDSCQDWRYFYNATNRDTLLRLATTEVQVTADAKALQIAIEPEKAVYAPGESMRAVIRVTDSAGKPVRAELSLAVVDEAIFLLKNEEGAGIFNAFYGPRQHSVTTFDSMQPSRYVPGSHGGGGYAGEIPDSVLRDNFPDTTTWLPAIETDSQGQAVVELTLPDNTTSWRLTAKAVTRTHQVGEAFTQIETRKEVFVRPVLPRVLTRGDQASLTAFVHNTGSQAQNLTVKLSAPGLQLLDEASQTVTVPPGVSQRVEWPVRVAVSTPTEATISLAGAQGVVDAVRLPLLIQPAAIREIQHVAGLTGGEAILTVNLPEVDVETSQVTLNLTRSPAGTLLNGLEFLIGYPYGCVEQTMSRALPNAVVSQAASRLNIGGPELKAALDPMILASIHRLYGLQHSDGGWGWWTDDDSTPYQTAWVLYGLGVMSHAGYEIDPDVIQNAVEWLDRKYSYRGELDDPREEIYARFAMAEAGFGDLQRVRALAAQEDYALDPFSRAALALALYDLGDVEQARIQLGLLNQDVQVKDEMAFWSTSTGDGEYRSKTMASTVRSTALALIANTRIEPENPLIVQAVNYLVAQRKGNRGWGTTNETSYTILALVDALALQDQQAEDSTYAVLLNGKPLADGALNAAQPNVRVVIPVSQMKPGKNAVQLQTNDESLVYYDLNADLYTLQIPAEPAGTIEVERRYLDPSTRKPLEEIQAGQLVLVELKVNTQQPLDYVAVEDHLPGGLEALNEGLNTQNWAITVSYWYDYEFFLWEDYGYNYKEIRADRVVFFITRDFRNSRTFTYMARATTSGTFLALPAQVYAMYDLSMWGRSDSAEVVIKR
ncbi:MAG: hypothetical protein HY835_13755 [Anaerolineae bacterium]|nr:hypothetical protein [Anaerolineae bacterium]